MHLYLFLFLFIKAFKITWFYSLINESLINGEILNYIFVVNISCTELLVVTFTNGLDI